MEGKSTGRLGTARSEIACRLLVEKYTPKKEALNNEVEKMIWPVVIGHLCH